VGGRARRKRERPVFTQVLDIETERERERERGREGRKKKKKKKKKKKGLPSIIIINVFGF